MHAILVFAAAAAGCLQVFKRRQRGREGELCGVSSSCCCSGVPWCRCSRQSSNNSRSSCTRKRGWHVFYPGRQQRKGPLRVSGEGPPFLFASSFACGGFEAAAAEQTSRAISSAAIKYIQDKDRSALLCVYNLLLYYYYYYVIYLSLSVLVAYPRRCLLSLFNLIFSVPLCLPHAELNCHRRLFICLEAVSLKAPTTSLSRCLFLYRTPCIRFENKLLPAAAAAAAVATTTARNN